MNSAKLGLATFALTTLLACTISSQDQDDTGTDDTADTGDTADTSDTGTADPTEITSISIDCVGTDAPGDVWSFAAVATGDAALIELDVVETGASPGVRWQENGHTSDAALAIALTSVAGTGNVVIATAGAGNTAFHCAWDNGTSLAFKATLIDGQNAVADCAIWGYHAASDAFPDSTCECMDADGDCTN